MKFNSFNSIFKCCLPNQRASKLTAQIRKRWLAKHGLFTQLKSIDIISKKGPALPTVFIYSFLLNKNISCYKVKVGSPCKVQSQIRHSFNHLKLGLPPQNRMFQWNQKKGKWWQANVLIHGQCGYPRRAHNTTAALFRSHSTIWKLRQIQSGLVACPQNQLWRAMHQTINWLLWRSNYALQKLGLLHTLPGVFVFEGIANVHHMSKWACAWAPTFKTKHRSFQGELPLSLAVQETKGKEKGLQKARTRIYSLGPLPIASHMPISSSSPFALLYNLWKTFPKGTNSVELPKILGSIFTNENDKKVLKSQGFAPDSAPISQPSYEKTNSLVCHLILS